MGNCLSCGHEYERHLFGGMCFYCDCKKAVYNTGELATLKRHDPSTERTNGRSPGGKPGSVKRLGNK